MSFRNFIRCLLWSSCVLLSACAGSKSSSVQERTKLAQTDPIELRNQKIRNSAMQARKSSNTTYLLGAGDVLQLTVFQVPELNIKARVNGRGQIMLPLLGLIEVDGLSVNQVESTITDKLSAKYLQNPQVSLFVDEYRSQEITVMGAVKEPNVYRVRQPRGVFEILSMAGGLSKTAGDIIRIHTTQFDPESNQTKELNLLLSVDKLLTGNEAISDLRLHGGDSIIVPEAGVVFVEGAVKKPGSYKMQGETNVLKAIAMAGGVPWSGRESRVEVIREIAGEPTTIDVNLNKVRKQRGEDVVLQNGDIVVVSYSVTKRALSGFFKAAGQILGYSLN